MTLQAVFTDKAQIPAGLEGDYLEVDGQFLLTVPGMKTQADFDKYADALKKRYADAGADFARQQGAHLSRDDILEVVTKAIEKANPEGAKPAGGNGKGGDQGSGEVAQRLHDLERNVASQTQEIDKLTKERDAALGNSRDTTIRNALTEAATAALVRPEGVPNLVSLTQKNFEIAQDGTVVTKLEAGPGVSPNVQPADYYASLARAPEFRMFWPKSTGAGAGNGDGAGGGGGQGDLGKANPWTKAGWNMTEQGRIYTADRTEAERLMGVAGVKLGATAAVR